MNIRTLQALQTVIDWRRRLDAANALLDSAQHEVEDVESVALNRRHDTHRIERGMREAQQSLWDAVGEEARGGRS